MGQHRLEVTHRTLVHFCPFQDCARSNGTSRKGWADVSSVKNHVRTIHLSAGLQPPAVWLQTYGLEICMACKEMRKAGKQCNGPKCTAYQLWQSTILDGPRGVSRASPDGPSIPLDQPEPISSHTCSKILHLNPIMLRRIPPGAASQFALALGTNIATFCRHPSWASLQRLLLFPRIALNPPQRTGKRLKYNTDSRCRVNCIKALDTGLSELVLHLTNSRTPRLQRATRKRSRNPDNPEDIDIDDLELDLKTLDAVRSLVAEGAPAKAL